MGVKTLKRARKDGPADGQSRRCAVLREQRSPADLIRFVPSPDGIIVPDLARRLPGRGIWLSCSRDILAKAVKINAFQRSLKTAIKIPDDLPELVERLLRKRVMECLGLAKKAGLVSTGFTRVNAALSGDSMMALVHGCDGSDEGRSRLTRKFQAIRESGGAPARIISCLTIDELSLALGRSNVVHAALAKGGATGKFIAEASRLHNYGQPVATKQSAAATPDAA